MKNLLILLPVLIIGCDYSTLEPDLEKVQEKLQGLYQGTCIHERVYLVDPANSNAVQSEFDTSFIEFIPQIDACSGTLPVEYSYEISNISEIHLVTAPLCFTNAMFLDSIHNSHGQGGHQWRFTWHVNDDRITTFYRFDYVLPPTITRITICTLSK